MNHPWLLITLALSLALACTPSQPPSAAEKQAGQAAVKEEPKSGAAPAAKAPDGWEATLAAARQEGSVAIAGPPLQGFREALMKFEEAYPGIKVDYGSMPSAEFEPRYAAERRAGQHLWDIRITGLGSVIYTAQIPEGWYDPLKPVIVLPEVLDDQKWIGGFEGGWMDNPKEKVYAYASTIARSIRINRDVVPESEFSKLEDFLNPKWKGKIVWLDPRIPGSGQINMALIRRFLGDDGARTLLLEQDLFIVNNTRQVAELVSRGQYPISIGATPTDFIEFTAQGLGQNVKPLVLPTEQTIKSPGFGAMMLMDQAPNPNAAKVYANWLLTQPGQHAWASLGKVNSRRTDVEPGDPEGIADPALYDRYADFNSEASGTEISDAGAFARSVIGS